MSISASFSIGQHHLAGNPVLMHVSVTPGVYVEYRVMYQSSLVYKGLVSSLTGMMTLDLSRLFIPPIGASSPDKYSITLYYDDVLLQSASIYVYPGGISKRLFRALAEQNLNIFDAKLNRSTDNFFLTTRSFSKIVKIPEDELLPLFWYRNKSFNVMGQAKSSADNTISSIDLNAERLRYWNSNSRLENIIDITSGGSRSVRFVITKAEAVHKYFIKYRNAFGQYEKIALRNEMDASVEVDKIYVDSYDRLSDDVMRMPYESRYRSVYNGTLRSLDNNEAHIALEMLMSREQYLITPQGEFMVEVLANGEQAFQTTDGRPVRIAVEIRAIEEERVFTPLDMERLSFLYENIFTAHYGAQFT